MTTAPTRSWRATTARRWRKCFSTSRVGGWRRAHDERDRHDQRDFAASHPCDGAALLVSPDVVLAAAAGTGLLAGAADHHLGLSAELYLADVGIFRPPRRVAFGRGDPVGNHVPRSSRFVEFLSRGNVGAQSRQPDDEPAEADR